MGSIDAVSSLMNQLAASEVYTRTSSSQTPAGAVQQVLDQQQQNTNIQFGMEALKLSLAADPVASIVNVLV
jgi:hypothetical protein